jgi:murein L,D-transpeptidase YcbB/YkuD
MVVVNIPEYVLRAYEGIDGRIRLRLNMRVIVGKAMDHETPLFDERMRSIEFSPYWNVPPSIARAETVPRLRRDPGHWDRQGFEFVAPDGSVDTVLSRNKLDAVLAGRLRIRQRPGPANALGDVKFVLPNQNHIFLHHTPSVGLFARERRDFSHGCIRVEDPVALARFVMDGMPGWDEARIRSQMALGTSTHVALQQPLPVVIAYGTVLVKDGRTHFFSDVYGHDARLQAAIDSLHNRPREIPR